MPGRIETYLHSDLSSFNKGGCMVQISCETDFSAKTDEFIEFCKYVARMAYAVSTPDTYRVVWHQLVDIFPEVAERKKKLEETIKEMVSVHDAIIQRVDVHLQLVEIPSDCVAVA